MFSTAEAAREIGASKNTLLRWIAEGRIRDVERDWRGWRVWSRQDIERARAFMRAYHSQPIGRTRRRRPSRTAYGSAAGNSMADYAGAWARRAQV